MAASVRIRTESGEESLDLEELEARISRGEVAPHCPVLFPTPQGPRWVKAEELELFQARFSPSRHTFARRFKLARVPWLTLGLLAVNLAVFLAMKHQGGIDTDATVRWGAKALPLVGDLGQLWRLLTANFIHRDWVHLGFNLFVLFNAGGALENAYRPLDYLALLLASALGCTLTSLALADDAISVGASGIAFGCLGAVVIFGLRHREILPRRYRQLLGEAAIPAVLVFLYMGWSSPGVDNWGHLGGLLFGSAMAGVLPARLLLERRTSYVGSALRAGALAAVVLFLLVGGRLLAPALPPLVPVRDDASGLEVRVPATWRKAPAQFGPLAFSNRLPGVGQARFSASVQELPAGGPLAAQAARLVEGWLRGPEARQEPSALSIGAPVAVEVAGRSGIRLDARYVADEAGATAVRAYFIPRGTTLVALVFALPEAYPGYARVADAMVSAFRFTEPGALRQARARVLLDPGSADALSVLADVLGALGEPEAAAEALAQAEPLRSADASLPGRRARLLLQLGDVETGCAEASRAVKLGPDMLDALLARARCLQARGDAAGARAALEAAQKQAPRDPEVQRALQDLPR